MNFEMLFTFPFPLFLHRVSLSKFKVILKYGFRFSFGKIEYGCVRSTHACKIKSLIRNSKFPNKNKTKTKEFGKGRRTERIKRTKRRKE